MNSQNNSLVDRYICCKRVWYSLVSITHMVQKTWVRILVGCSRRYCFVRAHWTTSPSVPLSCCSISSSLWNNKYRAFRDILLKIIQAKMLPVRKATVDGRASRRFSSSCFVCSCPNNTLADCSYGPIADGRNYLTRHEIRFARCLTLPPSRALVQTPSTNAIGCNDDWQSCQSINRLSFRRIATKSNRTNRNRYT